MKKAKRGRIHRAISITTFAEMDAQDRNYWHRQTPNARLRAMEIMRRINYGKAATGRIQRIFEVIHLKANKAAAGRLKDLDDLEHLP